MQNTYSPRLPGWNPAPPKRHAAAAVLLLHVAGIALLVHAGHKVAKQLAPSPVEIAIVQEAPPTPATPTPLPSPQVSLPLPQLVQLPMPEIVPVTPVREVQASTEPPPAPPAPPKLEPVTRSAVIAPQPPAPKAVAASSLRWRVEPAVEVPRLSRRAGEQGRVQLAVVFDAEGRPASVQLLKSAGFARLDAQALEAIRVARITPYVEDGRALPISTVVNLEYELD